MVETQSLFDREGESQDLSVADLFALSGNQDQLSGGIVFADGAVGGDRRNGCSGRCSGRSSGRSSGSGRSGGGGSSGSGRIGSAGCGQDE